MTPTQKSNLARLALYLRKQKPSKAFDMGSYAQDDGFQLDPYGLVKYKKEHPCGTSCCAAGHGPLIGIAGRRGEGWADYIDRVFGVYEQDDEWQWCFSNDWESNPKQAAMRIGWLLTSGMEHPYVAAALHGFNFSGAPPPPPPLRKQPDWDAVAALVRTPKTKCATTC